MHLRFSKLWFSAFFFLANKLHLFYWFNNPVGQPEIKLMEGRNRGLHHVRMISYVGITSMSEIVCTMPAYLIVRSAQVSSFHHRYLL